MTEPVLTLEGVSYVLPDGRTLFTALDETFDRRHTGLVGRNGVGKSVLARILAGHLQPTRGHCLRSGNVHYLAQQVDLADDASVASLAGLHHVLAALARIEAGSSAPRDFDAVGERWDIRQRLRSALQRQGLGHLHGDTPARHLSGGEAMRVALAGAWLAEADFLILDEPSNHLDRPQRQALIEQLRQWHGGLLVISHDRQLLEGMARIVELSPQGLRSHGGNYGFYAAARAQEQHNAVQRLEQHKQQRQRAERELRQQRERQERRQARGDRQGKVANQARILLDRQKERSQASAGKLGQQQRLARQALDRQVREAARQVQDDAPVALHALPVAQAGQRRVVELEDVELPLPDAATRHISLLLHGQQRVGVVGHNGCGKSTLLKLLAGQLTALAGSCTVTAGVAHLDQRLANLEPRLSVLEQMRAANPRASESELRMRLAQLGLDAGRIVKPSGTLSGGERTKAALACLLYADPAPQLLLLDEPGNHLDLPSLEALETMLRGYRGALVVVAHDDAFLDRLGLTQRLLATDRGWTLVECQEQR